MTHRTIQHWHRRQCPALFLLALCLLLLPVAPALAIGLEEKVVEHRLANGLQLLVVDRPETPVVTAYITIGVGAVHETSESRGVAHLLEHMLFKGTQTIGTTDYAREKPLLERIEAVGSELDRLRPDPKVDPARLADLEVELARLQAEHKQYVVKDEFSRIYGENGGVGYNAFTSKDLTTYLISLPANKLELWALVESDRMQNPVLREFYTEREVIREERRRSYETSPRGLLYETLIANAFTVHPYREPIIGWHSDIANLTIAETRDFLLRYYAPVNTVIALVGDVRPAEAIALVERYFGDIPAGTPVPPVVAVEPPQKVEKRVRVAFDAEPQLAVAFHKPTLPHRDDYVFDLLDQVLGQGRTSRLYRALVEEQRLATSVATYGAPGARYPNLFVINAVPRHPHTADEVEAAIFAELERLRLEPVSDAELRKARNRLVTDQLRYLRSNSGLARILTTYQSLLGDWRYLVSYQEQIDAVTAAEIMRAAQTYFRPTNRTVVVLDREEG
ncbi:MAG: pitrilysin family protein [Desulfuromonadales bacterium]|nr:pitrilysin family protein [Desulfuromonadales bacterium]